MPMRGGARKGAGRKPAPSKMIAVVIWLPSELLAWLDSQAGNRGEIVRGLITKEMKND